MNGKVFTILNTSCLSELSRIRAAKTLKKIRIADRQWGSNFPRRGKKTNILKENYDHCCFCYHDSTHFSILGVSANALCDCHSGFVDSYFIHCVYMINKIIHGCYRVKTLEEKFHIYARPCNILDVFPKYFWVSLFSIFFLLINFLGFHQLSHTPPPF